MSDKTETNPILVNTYGTKAPDASKFGVGARSIEQIKQATDARRELASNPTPRRDSR
jgi:hypothetical protein